MQYPIQTRAYLSFTKMNYIGSCHNEENALTVLYPFPDILHCGRARQSDCHVLEFPRSTIFFKSAAKTNYEVSNCARALNAPLFN